MEKNTIIVGALLLVAGFVAGYLVWGQENYPVRSNNMMDDGMMGQDIDKHFITGMIPHHEGAIAMAQIALERGQRAEVLSLARGIIEAQEQENADMRGWYQSWYGASMPSAHAGHMHMDGMEGDTSVLESISDEEFDREFVRQMIPHHEMAIMMAQMLQSGTKRDEMKELSDNIITSQSREIEMMRGWLQSW